VKSLSVVGWGLLLVFFFLPTQSQMQRTESNTFIDTRSQQAFIYA